MTVLTTDAAISRFGVNEDKVNTFVNETGFYTTVPGGVNVQTLPSFIAANQTLVNSSVLSLATPNIRGAWAATTVYAIKDVVSNGGTWYICLTAHTSGGSFPGAGSIWTIYQGVTTATLSATTGAAGIGCIQTGTGAINDNVQTKLRDFVSVRGQGALGSPTDDTTAINNAYAICKEPYFPEGNYLTSITATRRYSGPGEIYNLSGVPAANFIKAKKKKTYVIVLTGQSNAAGINSGGPNPANSLVKVWDGISGAWGSSDYTATPFSRAQPDGNLSSNNIGLSLAHRLADEEGASVYLIYDAYSGRPISDWIGSGTSSVRYAAIKAKVTAAFATTELTSIGKTQIDYLLWAQGEEDALIGTQSTYLANFTTLDAQFRAESWMSSMTPMLIMGMSGLHDRYQVWQAQIDYSRNVNANCIYVNSRGLKTQYDATGSGDFTHWLGPSLWEHGYHRAWYALQERGMSTRSQPSPLYARGTGPYRGENDAITMFDNMVSYSSRTGGVGVTDNYTGDGSTTVFTLTVPSGVIDTVTVAGVVTAYSISGLAMTISPAPANTTAIVVTYSQTISGPSAIGAISWGYRCSADGNYSMAGGYLTTTDNLTNYSFGWGRSVVFTSTGDYSGGFGFQNTISANYCLVAGRGQVVVDDGMTSVGIFPKYITTQTDPVVWQVGVGGSTGSRANAGTLRKSGVSEHLAVTFSTLPAASIGHQRAFITDSSVTTFATAAAGGGSNHVPVYSDGTTWRVG